MLRIMGQLDDALRELEPLTRDASPGLRIQILLEQADCLARLGRAADGTRLLARARAQLRGLSEVEPVIWRRYYHARMLAAIGLGSFQAAERAAMSAVRGLKDDPEVWWYYHDVAETCLFNGKPLTALRHFAHGQRLAAEAPSIMGEIWTRLGSANADYYLAKPNTALKTVEETEQLIRRAEDDSALIGALLHRVRINLDLGEIGAARVAAESACALRSRSAAADYVRSLIEYACANWRDALSLADASLQAGKAIPTPLQLVSGIPLTLADLDVHREAVLLELGDTAGVRERLGSQTRSFYPRVRLRALGLLAECAHREGHDHEAATLYREALASPWGKQETRERGLLLRAWAKWSPEVEQFRKSARRSRPTR